MFNLLKKRMTQDTIVTLTDELNRMGFPTNFLLWECHHVNDHCIISKLFLYCSDSFYTVLTHSGKTLFKSFVFYFIRKKEN